MFSKVSRADRVREGRGGEGQLVGNCPHQLFADLEAHPSWIDFLHFPIYQLLSTFLKVLYRLFHLPQDCIEPDGSFPSPVRGCNVVENVRTLCVKYRDPKYDEDFIFPAKVPFLYYVPTKLNLTSYFFHKNCLFVCLFLSKQKFIFQHYFVTKFSICS